jgi:hypothetical protein
VKYDTEIECHFSDTFCHSYIVLYEEQFYFNIKGARGGAVVEALRYKTDVCGIDSGWCHWNFSLK